MGGRMGRTGGIALAGAFTGLVAFVACGSDDDVNAASDGGTSTSSSSSSASSTSSSGGSTAEGGAAPCGRYARAICAWVARCASNDLRFLYGDVETCHAREALECDRTSTLDGAAVLTDACVSALEALTSCAPVMDPYPFWIDIAACDLRGSVATGAKCERSRQCQSGLCTAQGSSSPCGTCKERVAEHGTCTPFGFQDCVRDLKCTTVGVSPTCEKLAQKGEACPNFQCAKPYRCDTTKGCIDPLPKDAPCAEPFGGEDPCDAAAGMSCRDGKCQEKPFASAGEPCGGGTPAVLCRGGLTCRTDGGGQGTCQPLAADGQSCGNGQNCWFPMTCVNGTCAIAPNENCK